MDGAPRPRSEGPRSRSEGPRSRSEGSRRATNLSIDEALLAEAKALSVNLSRAAERGIAEAVAQARGERWLAENREALESSNAYVEAHGLPLARYRGF